MRYEGQLAETVTFTAHGGDTINAYLARPLGAGPFPGVVVIHHMPGWDEASKEITRRFAAHGYAAICPNLHYREAPDAAPDDAAAASRAAGGVPDERLVGDVEGALRVLYSAPWSNGKAGTIGYCSGGRQSFLAACSLPLDAAVCCYPGAIANEPPPGSAFHVEPPLRKAEHLSCPVLGLFGAEDTHPGPDEVAKADAELTRLEKEHEFHTFENAGHAFFAVDNDGYRVRAATEGWRLVFDFFGRHLAEA